METATENLPSQSTPVTYDVLVVVSKVKKRYKRANLQTSEGAISELNVFLYGLLDEAGINAKEDGRKTVMARDIAKALKEMNT